MIENPKVSIVIPVFNGSNYLDKAIDSALGQTYSNIEVIVVNDGSDDNGETEKIAKSYGNRIKYSSKPNGGVASAVNLGIEEMQGEYFAWLSHDDEYYPYKIERQIKALEKADDGCRPVIGAYDIYNVKEEKAYSLVLKSDYLLKQMENGVFPILSLLSNAGTMLIHKSYFKKYGKFNEALLTTQDYDFLFRILHDNNAIFINEPLAISRYHEEQGSKTIGGHNRNCDELQLKMIHELLGRPDEITKIYKNRYHFFFEMAKLCRKVKFPITYRQTLYYLLCEEEPKGLREAVRKRQPLLTENHRIIIWGTGEDGKNMLRSLSCRDIHVSYFVDNDRNKIGTRIGETECIDFAQIDWQNDIIIIAITKYNDVYLQVKNKGAKHIVLQAELDDFFSEIPIGKNHLQEYFEEKWEKI